MPLNVNDCELIVIEALDTESGICAEYEYIDQIYGEFGVGWELLRQRVTTRNPNKGGDPVEVDILTIKLPSGEVKDIAFDITSFYGK